MRELTFKEFIDVLREFEDGDFSSLDEDKIYFSDGYFVIGSDNYLSFKSCPIINIAVFYYRNELLKYLGLNSIHSYIFNETKKLTFEELIDVLRDFECGDFSSLDEDEILCSDNCLSFKSRPVRYIVDNYYSDEYMNYLDYNFVRVKEKSETSKRERLKLNNERYEQLKVSGLIVDEVPFKK